MRAAVICAALARWTAACGFVIAAGAGSAAAACSVIPRGVVPIERAGGLMVVSVTINGVPSPFLLDTGAERTVIGTEAASAIKLIRDEWVSTDVLGLGGRDRERLGRPASLSLGGIPLRRRTVAADNTVVVGPIPTQVAGHPIAGLLGQDFLSPFDLDLDPAHSRMTLYDVSGCVGDFIPWKERYTALQIIRLVRNVLALVVEVNGLPMRAVIDSGAQTSLLTAPGVQRLGVAPGGNALVSGFGRGAQMARLATFPVRVGKEALAAMPLLVTQTHLMRSIDMLLGADWLGQHHVWLSWSTDQVMVAAAPPPQSLP